MTVLGGTAQVDDWSLDIRDEDNELILASRGDLARLGQGQDSRGNCGPKAFTNRGQARGRGDRRGSRDSQLRARGCGGDPILGMCR